MLTILILLIVSVTVLTLLLLVVVLGIRQEPPTEELSEHASNLIAAFVCRLLGLHVRKPGSPRNLDRDDERPCLAHAIPRTEPICKPGPDER